MLLAVVLDLKAPVPIAILLLPVVLEYKAGKAAPLNDPTATLELPVLLAKALSPIATFPLDVVLELKASKPTATL